VRRLRAPFLNRPALRRHDPHIAVLVKLPQAGGVRMVSNLVGDPMQVVTIGDGANPA
jgi:hypothetical protein